MVEMTLDLTEYFDFIEPEVIRVRGHRLGIEHILQQYLGGLGPEQIADEFPGLPIETVYAAITFYLTHRLEMDRYLHQRRLRDEAAYQTWLADPPPHIERLRAIREQQSGYMLP